MQCQQYSIFTLPISATYEHMKPNACLSHLIWIQSLYLQRSLFSKICLKRKRAASLLVAEQAVTMPWASWHLVYNPRLACTGNAVCSQKQPESWALGKTSSAKHGSLQPVTGCHAAAFDRRNGA